MKIVEAATAAGTLNDLVVVNTAAGKGRIGQVDIAQINDVVTRIDDLDELSAIGV